MVHTSMPIITAIVALSAAAPIFAAPLDPRIDSGFSSVNNPAPPDAEQARAALADSAAGGATAINLLNHHLAAREVGFESSAKTGSAKSGLIAQGLLGRTVLPAISSILRREPEFADSFSRELATELKARSAISSAITGRDAGFAATKNLVQHLNRADGTSVAEESAGSSDSSSSESDGYETPPSSIPSSDDELDPPLPPPPPPPHNTPEDSDTEDDAGPSSPPTPPNTPEPPSEGGSSSTPSTGILSNSAKTAITTFANLGDGGFNAGAAIGKALKTLRGLDADTLRLLGRDLDTDTLRLLLGRNLEDLFARSFGIDELD